MGGQQLFVFQVFFFFANKLKLTLVSHDYLMCACILHTYIEKKAREMGRVMPKKKFKFFILR